MDREILGCRADITWRYLSTIPIVQTCLRRPRLISSLHLSLSPLLLSIKSEPPKTHLNNWNCRRNTTCAVVLGTQKLLHWTIFRDSSSSQSSIIFTILVALPLHRIVYLLLSSASFKLSTHHYFTPYDCSVFCSRFRSPYTTHFIAVVQAKKKLARTLELSKTSPLSKESNLEKQPFQYATMSIRLKNIYITKCLRFHQKTTE